MQNNLRVERAIKNITQEELARLIGVSPQTINAMELTNVNLEIGSGIKTIRHGLR
jgi:DNA-binding XRE family transcriptional regulator